MTSTMIFAGSERQAAFCVDMLAEIHGSREAGQAAFDASVAAGRMSTRSQVRAGVDFLIAKRAEFRSARKALAVATVAVLAVEAGFVYYSAQGIVRVVRGKTTGNVYAERLDAETGKFVYARGAIRMLEADATARKMTLEEAKRESVLFGQCMRCSAVLKPGKDGEQRFIGPVCVKYFD